MNPIDKTTISELMVPVPKGVIELRDDRLEKMWEVKIAPFLCAMVPVTQEFYFRISGENPSTFEGADLPVDSVSWNDAVRFCNRLSDQTGLQWCYAIVDEERTERLAGADGFRLLTEAEWEYACRAGTITARYGQIDAVAWYKNNSDGRTHAVGQKEPNNWGLFDMLGNVWEWCENVYDREVYGSYRIMRGGGWNDVARGCLASNRRRSHPTFAIDDLGFRIARSL
jgi:formylglycine-generating enzyme required for sulfatase activity